MTAASTSITKSAHEPLVAGVSALVASLALLGRRVRPARRLVRALEPAARHPAVVPPLLRGPVVVEMGLYERTHLDELGAGHDRQRLARLDEVTMRGFVRQYVVVGLPAFHDLEHDAEDGVAVLGVEGGGEGLGNADGLDLVALAALRVAGSLPLLPPGLVGEDAEEGAREAGKVGMRGGVRLGLRGPAAQQRSSATARQRARR